MYSTNMKYFRYGENLLNLEAIALESIQNCVEDFRKYNGRAFDPEKHIFALTSEIMLELVSEGKVCNWRNRKIFHSIIISGCDISCYKAEDDTVKCKQSWKDSLPWILRGNTGHSPHPYVTRRNLPWTVDHLTQPSDHGSHDSLDHRQPDWIPRLWTTWHPRQWTTWPLWLWTTSPLDPLNRITHMTENITFLVRTWSKTTVLTLCKLCCFVLDSCGKIRMKSRTRIIIRTNYLRFQNWDTAEVK